MIIGILNEQKDENRVGMLPESISDLKDKKLEVVIEKGAGDSAYALDKDYEEVGTKIVSRQDVIKKSDIIVQINPPLEEDVKHFMEGQVLISVLNPYFNLDLVKQLSEQKVTSFSLDIVPRITRAQSIDIKSAMGTISGYKAVIDAAHNLPFFFPMFMSATGTIKPAKILILGAGVAGLQAVAIARKLGAIVEVFDVRSAVKEEVMSLGGKFVEVDGASEDKTAGGYAIEQSEEFKKKQEQLIHEHAVKSDVVICTAQIPGKRAPVLLKKETVESMRPGAIIIDLAASTGGNCEVTKNAETIIHKNVKVIGNSDYPSDMPYAASKMFGKSVVNFLKLIIDEEGNLNLDFENEIIKETCVTHNGNIVNDKILKML